MLAAALSGQPPPPCRAAVDYVRPPCGHRCQLPCHTRAALADWTPTPVVDAEGVVHEGTAAPAKPPVPLPMPALCRVGVRPVPCPENQSPGRFSSGYLGTTESQRDGRADRQTEMVVGTGIMGSYVYHISVYGQQDKEDETEATPTFPIIFRTQPCGGPAWRHLPVRRRSRSCDAARRGTRSAGRARRRRRRSRKAPRRAGRRWCRSCRPGLLSLIGHVGKSCLFGKFAFAPSLVSIAKK